MRSAEKRKLERFKLEMPARIKRVQSTAEPDARMTEMNGLTRDVSSGGAFIRSEEPLPKGSEIIIQLTLPLDKFKSLKTIKDVQIKVTGKIIRIESSGFGVSFNDQFEIKPNK